MTTTTAGGGVFLAAAAILVDRDGRVLLSRRPEGRIMAGMWEFPGGKVEPFETPERALIRELREELGIDATSSCLAPFSFTTDDRAEGSIVVLFYLCRKWEGIARPLEGQGLRWTRPDDWKTMPILKANAAVTAMLRDELIF